MKRNDIIYSRIDAERGYTFYGRVSRILPDGMVETVDCGRYIRVQRAEDIVLANEYKGFKTWGNSSRFIRMATLRQLKQMCSRYDKTIWKRNRNSMYCDRTRFIEKEIENDND